MLKIPAYRKVGTSTNIQERNVSQSETSKQILELIWRMLPPGDSSIPMFPNVEPTVESKVTISLLSTSASARYRTSTWYKYSTDLEDAFPLPPECTGTCTSGSGSG